MNPPTTSVWLHRFAWFTAALTLLLPVTTGAIVTTLKAGMVFSDWPTSDGYRFFDYPWFSAARDQFIEHGHRLSGGIIVLVSLPMAIVAWCIDHRPLVRGVATAIFATVIAQVALGGARVLLDKQTMALLHGDFAALVFSLMAILVLITGRNWDERPRLTSVEQSQSVTKSATLLMAALIAQYVMGGFLRHLRERVEFAWAWMVHPWFAVIVLFTSILFIFAAFDTNSPYIRRCGMTLVALTVVQSMIGLATWYFRYGMPSWGVVAQQDSIPQIVTCSLHTVVGMLTLMTSVLAVTCCWSLRPIGAAQGDSKTIGTSIAGAVI